MIAAYYFYPNDSTCYEEPQPGREPEAITAFTSCLGDFKEYLKKDYSAAGWEQVLKTPGTKMSLDKGALLLLLGYALNSLGPACVPYGLAAFAIADLFYGIWWWKEHISWTQVGVSALCGTLALTGAITNLGLL